MLPSYQEVIQERNIEKSEMCLRAFRVGFLIVNIFISLLTVGGFFIVRFTDTFRPHASNVTKYCNDSGYNVSPIPESSYFTAYAAILITFALCFVPLLTISNVKNCNVEKILKIKKMLWKTWILGLHLMFLFIFIEFLKCASGVPRPYFFSIQNITNVYCKNTRNEKRLPLSLEKLEDKLRKSFPSYRSAIYAFCVTFMYIYVDHFDIDTGLHAIQQVVIIAIGCYLSYFQFYSWEKGENHLSDILVGASIGTMQAMITVRGMFGSVFYSRIHNFTSETNNTGNFYLPTSPITFVQQSGYDILQSRQVVNRSHTVCEFSCNNLEFNHPLIGRTYESAQTALTDNAHDGAEENSLCTSNVFEIQNQEETAAIINEIDT